VQEKETQCTFIGKPPLSILDISAIVKDIVDVVLAYQKIKLGNWKCFLVKHTLVLSSLYFGLFVYGSCLPINKGSSKNAAVEGGAIN
jgi:hypothetical protein